MFSRQSLEPGTSRKGSMSVNHCGHQRWSSPVKQSKCKASSALLPVFSAPFHNHTSTCYSSYFKATPDLTSFLFMFLTIFVFRSIFQWCRTLLHYSYCKSTPTSLLQCKVKYCVLSTYSLTLRPMSYCLTLTQLAPFQELFIAGYCTYIWFS
jgi:hypothetical protein